MMSVLRNWLVLFGFSLMSTVGASTALAFDNEQYQQGFYAPANSAAKSSGAWSRGKSRLKPLEGKVDATGDWSDEDNLQRGRAEMDRAGGRRLPGEADAWQGGAQTGRMGGMRFPGQATSSAFPLQTDRSQFRLDTPKDERPPYPLGAQQTRLPGDVPFKEISLLKNYDVVIIQDRSSSMGEHEHLMGVNGYRRMKRWEWCLEQAMDLGRQTSVLPKWAFTLVLFSNRSQVFPNVVMSDLPAIYSSVGMLNIGTFLADPLGDQLSNYFQRRSAGSTKPLLVAVVTDGKPSDFKHVRRLLVETTYAMRNPNEIKVVFLQIGTDEDGDSKLFDLDRRLLAHGAKFDIVKVKPFSKVQQAGLARSLVDTVEGR